MELLAEFVHLVCLVDVAVLAIEVVAAEHERKALVRILAERVVRHRGVAGGISEGKDRLLADLLIDHGDFVHLEVLDDELAAEDQVITLLERVIQSVYAVLLPCHNKFIGTDDLFVGQYKRAVYHESPADEPVRAADHVNGKIIGFEVVHDLQHGLIESAAAGHALVAGHRQLLELLDIRGELLLRHALESRRDRLAVLHGKFLVLGAVLVLVLDLGCHRLLEFGSLVLVLGVFRDAVQQQCIVKIVRIRLAEQCPVKIEDRDTVLHGYVVSASLIGDRFHVGDQLLP